MTAKKKLVVIGNGMAPGRVLETLYADDSAAWETVIFNAEPRVNYNRIMLSPVLSGEKSYDDIIIHDETWYQTHNITLHKGQKITAIDRAAQTVTSESGLVESYDRLLIATGSSPFILPVPGKDLPGVVTYRDLDDVNAMLEAAKTQKHAVVIGGGLLGLEAAAGLKAQGMTVTVLHLMPTLMERQLDASAGYLLEREMRRRDIDVITKANTHALLGEDKVEAVKLDDGREIPADLVVMAVGIRPNAALAKEAGLAVQRGLIVNDQMETSDPKIFAVGECVEHRGLCYGLVAPLYEMATTIASQLKGDKSASYTGSVTSTKLKVTGVDLFSAGDFAEEEGREEIVLRDAAQSIYKRLVLKDNKIIGVVLYGDTGDGPWFFQLLKDQTDISDLRETLIFGQNFAGSAPLDPMAAVAALPDEAEICGCNGISKGMVVQAITEKGLTRLDDVRAHTKASSSCGSCTGQVEKLLAATLGQSYNPNAVKPLCGCTDLDHETVRQEIFAQKLTSIPAVMQALEWKSSCGCAKCRPALNYYLLSSWPGIYEDDYQSRFINERVHANIQKDGTFSVVPRMWGGITNANELRAIADVVDKYNIPTVKVTGGQRIDLLGVKKEDLLPVWADLNAAGMVSGHAYSKGLRTVKTCVGTDWCRFGTQDSTGLGIKLEKLLWGSWTPHKLKLAVTGCPRNCAEATCKDIGVVCIDGGYDIHIGGAAGMQVRETDLLCHVKSEAEVLEYAAAITQLYRRQGHYLERIYKWSQRVGLDVIKATLVDDAKSRQALAADFEYSQKFDRHDPWAERVQGKHRHQFTPLRDDTVLEAAE